jgi:hypothetical protein
MDPTYLYIIIAFAVWMLIAGYNYDDIIFWFFGLIIGICWPITISGYLFYRLGQWIKDKYPNLIRS